MATEETVKRALILNGVAGVGKSTVAQAIGGLLTATGSITAVVDTDALAQFGPPPALGERGFYDELKCLNLTAVWANFRVLGAEHLVVSAGIDSLALRARYAAGLADCAVQLVRLTAAPDTVRRRLRDRDGEAGAQRHLKRLAEQEARLDDLSLEDFTVVNDRPSVVVAREVALRAGWIRPGSGD